jgi:hypothetical protein
VELVASLCMETEREKRNDVREKTMVNVTNFSWVQETRGFGNDKLTISCARNSFFFLAWNRERERDIRSARNRERGNAAVIKYRLTSDVECLVHLSYFDWAKEKLHLCINCPYIYWRLSILRDFLQPEYCCSYWFVDWIDLSLFFIIYSTIIIQFPISLSSNVSAAWVPLLVCSENTTLLH